MKERALLHPFAATEVPAGTGAETELASIFQAYYQRVFHYIGYRVDCKPEAEDLTSMVFVKIMDRLTTYSSAKGPFEVWLFAIARNVVNDYYRERRKFRLFSLDSVKELVSGKKNPESLAIQGETCGDLARALATLTERERHLVALKFGAGLKNTEIAPIMDATQDHVGVMLYRTLKKLKKQLGSESGYV